MTSGQRIAGLVVMGGLLFAPAATAMSAGDEQLLAEAAEWFRQGRDNLADAEAARAWFARAADAFEELRRRGVHNPEHYLNQGNAELLAGRLPKAIRSYRRGLALAPNHAALQENLEHARAQVAYAGIAQAARPPQVNWPPWLPYPWTPILATAALGFYFLAFLAFTMRLMTGAAGWLAAGLLSLGAAALLGSAYAWLCRHDEFERTHPVVVVAADRTGLHRGNGTSYPLHSELPELRRGMEARRLHQRGAWLQIQFDSGATGWVPKEKMVE